MEWFTKMSNVIKHVRTPLALAGLVVIVLYALYRQILGMDIFTEVSASHTFALIDNILYYLFLLAVLAIVTGAIGYLLNIMDIISY